MSSELPAPTAAPAHLLWLVRRVAVADRLAFADLHDELADQLLADLRATLADPAGAPTLAAAVFVEVWWLARFHTKPGTDVHAWLRAIVARRIADLSARAEPTGGRPDTADRRAWWTEVGENQRRATEVALTDLLQRG